MTDTFALSIESQFWLGEEEQDLCSHGEIRLVVNGKVITEAGHEEEWGISESALALLRSLEGEEAGDSEKILHGCGTMLMLGCPISIHWNTELQGDTVRLSNFHKVETTTPETGTMEFPGLTAIISFDDYRRHVIQFAQEVKAFFGRSKPKKVEADDKEMYDEFWQEFDELFVKHS